MNVRKRGLALLMCICMIFTLLPFSAFADGTSEPDVVYGTYDENGTTWTQKTGLTAVGEPYTNSATGADVTYSKTATPVEGQKDTYNITLKIESKTSSTAPGASAVVLVIDNSGSMGEGSQRLKNAKEVAKKFVDNYGNSGEERYIALVGFAKRAVAYDFGKGLTFNWDKFKWEYDTVYWLDASDPSNRATIKNSIDKMRAEGGTNLQDGLLTADDLLDEGTAKGIAKDNKFAIALTDGQPTYYTNENDRVKGDGSSCDQATYNATMDAAKKLKADLHYLYTVCYGAQNEIIQCSGETVSNFLKDNIASSGMAYEASDGSKSLKEAFEKIYESIKKGLDSGFTVTDPMGKYIQLQETSLADCKIDSNGTITWTPTTGKVSETDGVKTYTYTLTYTVKLDTSADGFVDNKYYATNGVTTLAFKDGDDNITRDFNVPGVKGTAPKYNVTYKYTGDIPAGAPALPGEASYKAGEPVEVAPAPTLNGYTFSSWSTTDATVGSDGSFTMPSNKVTLTGSWTLRSDLSYTVHYYWNGTTDKVAEDKVVDGQTFNETVTETPVPVNGYTPVSDAAVELKIGTGTNEITFYYYKNVTLTAEDRIVTYNGQEQTVNTGYDVVVKADNGKNFKLSGAEFRGVYASGTGKEVGKYDIDFVGETVGNTDTTAKYIVANTVKGTLTITPIDTVVVTITGNTDTKVYNGAEQSVTGYTVKISDPKYTEADFKFTGDPKASRTDVGTTPMGLTANSFVNNNSNFKNVTFVVEEDGYLTITKRPLTIEGQSSEPITYDGQTHSFMDWWPVTATDNTGLVSGHEVSGISYLLTGKDAGSYTGEFTGTAKVMAGEVDVTGNYDIEYAPGEMLIEPAEKIVIKITGNTATETYDGTEQSVTGYTTDVPDSSITVALKEGKAATAKGTNVGKYMMGLEAEDFVVSSTNNYKEIAVVVEDGYLDITPITDEVVVTITGHKDEFTYDGQEHTVKGYDTSISNQLYKATDFTFTGKSEVSRTEVGTSDMGLKADQFKNVSTNFTNVKFVVNDGSITIKERPYRPNPSITDKITVEITGNSDSVVYDGTEHSVKDYTVKISDSRYTEKDFTFSGKALASGVNAGTYEMGLKADQFKNTNARFKNVEFIIKADGVLTITQRPLTITAGSAEGIAPVTCDKYTVEGLATGDKVDSVKITGIQSEPGESPNVASDAVIKNAKGEDVTANYKITYVNGVLKAIEVLNKEIHFNYVIGYTDGTIRPNNDISRAEVATIFFRLLTDEAREQYTTTAGNFTDVKAGMWCNRAIATLTNMGIIKGYTDGTFQPNKSITRAELATIIARFAKLDVNTKTFSDINGHWAQKNIELAAGNGWINGYEDGTFRPNNNITRAETFAMINRVLDRQTESVSDLLPTSEMNMWSDNLNENAWYYKDVQEATNYHKCDRVGDSVYEKWTEKVPDIDWASYQI